MNKLFVKVRCRAYMKKIKDGVCIVMYNPDGTVCTEKDMKSYHGKAVAIKTDYEKMEDVEVADLSEFCGESVEKVYRERAEETFTGVVVGYTTLKCKGRIGTDWNDNPYGGDFGYCFKDTTWAPKVAVVYFKNNCKRYVLLDDMEELE